MHTFKAKLVGILAAVILIGCSSAALAATHLVSVDWLAGNLKTSGVVVLDVSDFTKYERQHIPGAARAFGPWRTMNGEFVGYMMPKAPELVRMLRSYGVNNGSFVIIYDEGINAQDTAKSARALWTISRPWDTTRWPSRLSRGQETDCKRLKAGCKKLKARRPLIQAVHQAPLSINQGPQPAPFSIPCLPGAQCDQASIS